MVSPTTEQPYAAYTNTVDSSLRVTRWNGSAWTNVGSTLVTGALVAQYHMAIASNGTPYVVYREPTSPFKIYVQKFDGTSWSVLGGTAASAGDGRQPAIAIAPDGSPYIVYPDVTNNFAATVRRFDGTNWVTVGAPGIGTRSGNTSFGQPSIAISSSGTLYATYSDYSVATGFPYTRVARFDGTNWVNVGGAIGRITTHAFLAFSRTGDLHIAYRETSDYGGLTPAYPFLQNVMKWNGSTWVFVGSPDFAGASALTSMAFDPVRNVPYVLITDENQKISVKAPVQVLSNASPIQISLSAGNVSIASPASVAFPGVTVSNTLQTLDVSAGTFSIEDLK